MEPLLTLRQAELENRAPFVPDLRLQDEDEEEDYDDEDYDDDEFDDEDDDWGYDEDD